MKKVLVLDLGTTYFKAALFDGEGRLCGLRREHSPVRVPEAGRVELAVPAFRRCVTELVHGLADDRTERLSDVGAVTFSSQTNSFALLGEDGGALTPFVLWNDERALAFDGLDAALAPFGALRDRTGVPALTHAFMVAKLLWYQRQEPRVFDSISQICLISDYLTYWFTGQHVTEGGVAGLTGLLDIHGLAWLSEGLSLAGLHAGVMGRVARAGTDLGPVDTLVGAELGLPRGCRFVVGCLDQYAGAMGSGNVVPGGVSETTGTVLATVRCTGGGACDEKDGVFTGPAYDEGMYYEMVFGDRSANVLERYWQALPDRPSFPELDAAAARVAPGAEGVRIPADLAEIDHWGDRYEMGTAVRAILEGVAAALGEQVAGLCGDDVPGPIVCGGGGARSPLWLQIKADLLGVPTVAVSCSEPACLGGALLGLRALTGEPIKELVARVVRRDRMYEPDGERHTVYRSLRYSTVRP